MDWEMMVLQQMTIEIEFRRNNKPVFLATSWPGYIGVLTGMRLAVCALRMEDQHSIDRWMDWVDGWMDGWMD
jgi:hypothetical protein